MTAQDIVEFITTWLPMVFSVIGAASAAAAVTPKTGENQTWAIIRAVLNAVALNVGNAKNQLSAEQEAKK